MTITEFLTARYDEMEAVAHGVRYRGVALVDDEIAWVPDDVDAVAVNVDHVLADIAAKRAIVALHTVEQTDDGEECAQCSFHELYEGFNDVSEPWPCTTLRLLAQAYVEHADFDEGWRV